MDPFTDAKCSIKEGVPYKLACMAAGITYDCFQNWRQNDPDFDRQVDELVAKPAIDLFKVIREQAPETWQAGAWTLERRYPEMFAKPEAQLQLNILNQTAMVNGNDARNVERIVVSDLEFVGLQRHPSYKYEPDKYEIEGIPAEVAGSLKREGQAIVLISESKAAKSKARVAQIRARTVALFEKHRMSLHDKSAEQAAADSNAPKAATTLDVIHEAVARDAEQAHANQGARPSVAEQAWRDL